MRGRELAQEHRERLAIRTGSRQKDKDGVAKETDTALRRTSSNSIATSAEEQTNTHLSASSAGESSGLSSSVFSARSTARTSTSTMPSGEETANTSSLHPQPTITVLDLVSNSASASALPDGFDFSVSRKGTFIAVSSSRNIWLINAAMLPRLFTRTLEIRRKPIALDIMDDGSLLAVLSKPTQVDLYKLTGQSQGGIERHRTFMLENEAHTLAICPNGLVLATGHQYGIEIFSLGRTASESLRRTVACTPMDNLEFSDNGRTLLCTGSTKRTEGSTLFSINDSFDVPFTEDGIPIQQDVDKAWTTQILFPDKASIASQATLLPTTGQVNELFAYNSDEHIWGIYDLVDQAFTNQKAFLPEECHSSVDSLGETLPAVSLKAEYVALGLGARNTKLWVYCLGDNRFKEASKQEKDDESPNLDSFFSLPMPHGDGLLHQELAILRWVKVDDSPDVERLIAVGNVTVVSDRTLSTEAPALAQTSTGVVVIMDFDNKSWDKEASIPLKIIYDLDSILPGERLPEEDIGFEREVELERHRTVAQRRAAERADGGRSSGSGPIRSQTTAGRDRASDRHSSFPADEDDLGGEEVQAMLEAPYDNTQPRSHISLTRAATVAAVAPANRRHLRALPFRPLEYRRADGLREIPHESDADNWVPPPPPYTPKVDPTTSLPFSQTSTNPSAPVSSTNPSMFRRPPSRIQPGPSNSRSSAIPPIPPLPTVIAATSPYAVPSTAFSHSTSDLPLPSTRPSLLHPSTYPSPLPWDRRRSDTISPRASVLSASSSHAYPPSNDQPTYRESVAVARTRTHHSYHPTMATAHHTVFNPPFHSHSQASASVSGQPSFGNPFANLRRGSAPVVSSHGRRPQTSQGRYGDEDRRPEPDLLGQTPNIDPSRISVPKYFIVVVTGAEKGLGYDIALSFAKGRSEWHSPSHLEHNQISTPLEEKIKKMNYGIEILS
ncbi:hypothetical protein GQ43DRAFT_480213 [Delitschia confertaspora ATCC 74209]|uniref:DUF7165 domain-containing protein n=1 Tax=Delitschia confertaspora ATCC 74209 TaxID=1513339 RepID=A0A9P4JMB9_9PLEO|nr:hypothetical protein GQ43DRAFT_480213 [Delitschia confertaspora ATCC 74209]